MGLLGWYTLQHVGVVANEGTTDQRSVCDILLTAVPGGTKVSRVACVHLHGREETLRQGWVRLVVTLLVDVLSGVDGRREDTVLETSGWGSLAEQEVHMGCCLAA